MNECSYINTQIQATIEVFIYERWFIVYELCVILWGWLALSNEEKVPLSILA